MEWMTLELQDADETSSYERLRRYRTLFLTCDAEEDAVSDLIADMLLLEKDAPDKPINLVISSWGGALDMGMALYDIMKSLSCPVDTFALGKACSAAALILAAGTGTRWVYPSTRLMIHQPSGGTQYGTITDNEIARANDLAWKKLYLEALAECCGQPFKKVKKDCERDKWMSAEEAVAYGLADRIVALPRRKPLVK